MRIDRKALTALALAAALAPPAAAQQADPSQLNCAGVVPPMTQLAFDDGAHGRWYRRFWSGRCSGLGLACFPGSPNWNDILVGLVDRAAPAQRAEARRRACLLGRLVGHEWARANDRRRIHTRPDLERLVKTLEGPDVVAGLTRADALARGMLARP